jgi:soluble lytic murein transglycosylase-like protein
MRGQLSGRGRWDRWAAAAAGAALLVAPARLGEAPVRRVPEAIAGPESAPAAHDPRRPALAAEALRRRPSLGLEGAIELAQVILEESVASRLDPVLVLAMISVESAWETQAVSPRGARGLMQLRGSTQAGQERDAGVGPGNPHDPVHNVRMGVRYYGRMVETFGDPDLALVAYNAGPTRLASYIQAVGEVPDHLWSYARRVRREERRLRHGMAHPRADTVAWARAN